MMISVARSSIDVKDLATMKCRISGVALAESKDPTNQFNYTTAESVCQLLGLKLANKTQVEKARTNGLETCRFGWVADQIVVISRIQNNEKCGKNKTGVLVWSVPLTKQFPAYCFNVSDTWVNSCKPEIRSTTVPGTEAQSPTATQLSSTVTTNKASTESQTTPTTLHVVHTTPRKKETTKFLTRCITKAMLTTRMTTPEAEIEVSSGPKNQAALKTDQAIFGGLPTALLILALAFFIAALALAVCYIKKYKTNLLFTKKKEETEAVETKVFKETATSDNATEEEKKPNGTGAESPPTLPVTAGNCAEAEV
ncbi:lymphatic vessel endothelial hyaluronic acid receptor 1 [Ascaphus truei]|uniref:lymphatic vessel endothelial hyaluronic acid receptor 1 n=1 Tax=Ascaphus truei TaxID=8439 RepID=UPI003F590877